MNSFPGVDKDHADVKNLSDMASILQENNKIDRWNKEKYDRISKAISIFLR